MDIKMEYLGPDVLNMTRALILLHQFNFEATTPATYVKAFYAPSFCPAVCSCLWGSEFRISRQMNHYNEMNDIIGCLSSVFRHSAGDLDTPMSISVVSVHLWNSL